MACADEDHEAEDEVETENVPCANQSSSTATPPAVLDLVLEDVVPSLKSVHYHCPI